MQLRMEMSQREKIIWTIVITLIVGSWIEFTYKPVGFAVDVGTYAANRWNGNSAQQAAIPTPKTTKVSRARSTKSSSPASDSYTVSPGETVYAINRKYDDKLDIKATCALNNLGPKCKVKAGQDIHLAMRQ